MSKSTKKRSPASRNSTASAVTRPVRPAKHQQSSPPDKASKQSRVIAMLSLKDGTTIDAMMKNTGWQQHSVRGFLAGVVRKRLKLKLNSEMVNGSRVYRVAGSPDIRSGNQQARKR